MSLNKVAGSPSSSYLGTPIRSLRSEFITAIPFSCNMSLNVGAAGPSLSGNRSPVTAWSSLSVLGSTHPVTEVRHDARRASFERVLKRLPEPFRKTVERLSVACSTPHFLRLRWPVHHNRSDAFLPISKRDSPCSSLQSRRRVVNSHHVHWLPKILLHENRHPGRLVRASRLLVFPSYRAPENAFQINSREPENRIRIIELIEKR